MANSRLQNRYIFSGYKTDTESFDPGYNYQGDSGEINILIDRNAAISINIPGDTAFSYGGITFFETLDDFYNALMNNDVDAIRASIDSIDNALTQVSNVRANIGARMNYLENQKMNLEDRDLVFQTVLSRTEDDDIIETSSKLTKTELVLQSLRASGSEFLSQSLLDFLR